jgi:hypothetical protein
MCCRLKMSLLRVKEILESEDSCFDKKKHVDNLPDLQKIIEKEVLKGTPDFSSLISSGNVKTCKYVEYVPGHYKKSCKDSSFVAFR